MEKKIESEVNKVASFDINTISVVFLSILIFFSPFGWFPGLGVNSLDNVRHILLFSYVTFRGICYYWSKRIEVTLNIVTIILIFLMIFLSLGLHSNTQLGFILDYILIIIFGIFVIFHIAEDRDILWVLIFIYILSVSLQSMYSLIVVLTPLSPIPLPPTVSPYSEPFSALGFSVGPIQHATTVATAISLSAFQIKRSIFYKVATLILTIGLFWGVIASGWHGRSSFIILILAVMVYILRERQIIRAIPFLILSPLLLFLIMYLYISLVGVNDIIISLNEFFSGRLAIYYVSFDILFNNLGGIGFENFSELFKTPSWGAFGTPPDGPHNVFFSVSLGTNIIAGVFFLYWVLLIGRSAANSIQNANKLHHYSLPVVVVGIIFTGVSVGEMSPFTIYRLIIWWICLAGILSASYRGT